MRMQFFKNQTERKNAEESTLRAVGLRFAESVQGHFASALDVAVPDALLLRISRWRSGSS